MTDNNHRIAIIAQSLYILTALIPAIGFIFLTGFYLRHRLGTNSVNQVHLKQTFIAGCLITALFALSNAIIILTGGYHSINTIIVFEVYSMVFVPLFVFPGIFGLVKARSGESYRFPLLGKLIGIK